jgi:hypothetical protein
MENLNYMLDAVEFFTLKKVVVERGSKEWSRRF